MDNFFRKVVQSFVIFSYCLLIFQPTLAWAAVDDLTISYQKTTEGVALTFKTQAREETILWVEQLDTTQKARLDTLTKDLLGKFSNLRIESGEFYLSNQKKDQFPAQLTLDIQENLRLEDFVGNNLTVRSSQNIYLEKYIELSYLEALSTVKLRPQATLQAANVHLHNATMFNQSSTVVANKVVLTDSHLQNDGHTMIKAFEGTGSSSIQNSAALHIQSFSGEFKKLENTGCLQVLISDTHVHDLYNEQNAWLFAKGRLKVKKAQNDGLLAIPSLEMEDVFQNAGHLNASHLTGSGQLTNTGEISGQEIFQNTQDFLSLAATSTDFTIQGPQVTNTGTVENIQTLSIDPDTFKSTGNVKAQTVHFQLPEFTLWEKDIVLTGEWEVDHLHLPCTLVNQGYLTLQNLSTPVLKNQKNIMFKGTGRHDIRSYLNTGRIIYKSGGLPASASFHNHGLIHSQVPVEVTDEVPTFDNQNGILSSDETVTLKIHGLNNHRGKIYGKTGTDIQIKNHLNNYEGVLGTTSPTDLSVERNTKVTSLGTVTGTTTQIHSSIENPENSTYWSFFRSIPTLSAPDEKVKGSDSVSLTGYYLDLPKAEIETPELNLHAHRFALPPQRHVHHTVFHPLDHENFIRIPSYRTGGSFELNMKNRKPVKYFWENIWVYETLQADRGVTFDAPDYNLYINLAHDQSLTCELGKFIAKVRNFDLKSGVLAAQDGEIITDNGKIKVGRLVKDPTREVFSTLFCHKYNPDSCNLDNCIRKPSCEFLGETLENVYDGHHLFILPFATSNQSALIIKNKTKLQGSLQNQALIETNNLDLISPTKSLCLAGKINIRNDFYLDGILHLEALKSTIDFTYYNYKGYPTKFDFITSDPAELIVGGDLTCSGNSQIYNLASYIHVHKLLTSALQYSEETLITGKYQKVFVGTPQERQAIKSAPKSKWSKGISKPSNFRFYHRSSRTVYGAFGFLKATKDFDGAQNKFEPVSSFGTPVVLNTDRLEGLVSTPGLLVPLGSRGLRIQASTQSRGPQSAVADLGLQSIDQSRIQVNIDLKPSSGIQFRAHERFFYDKVAAQARYQKWMQDIHVLKSRGRMKKITTDAIFAMSPKLLLDNVREICQTKLNRGYIYEYQPLNMELLDQLHRNTTDYLQKHHLNGAEISTALVAQDPKIPLPDQPLIFYKTKIMTDGTEEFEPTLYFPPEMLNTAAGNSGSGFNSRFLAITPKSYAPQKLMQAFQAAPAIQQGMQKAFPNSLTYDHTEHQMVPRELPTVTLGGNIGINQMFIVNSGDITTHGHLTGQNILLASLHEDLTVASKITRQYKNAKNYTDVISDQAAINSQETLHLYGGRNLIFNAANTYSGQKSLFQAKHNIQDTPLYLTKQRHWYQGGKYHGDIITRTIRPQGSNHSTKGKLLSMAEGTQVHQGVKFEGKTGIFQAGGDIQQPQAYVQHTYEAHLKKDGGTFRSSKSYDTYSGTQKAVGSQYTFAEPIQFHSGHDISLTMPEIHAPITYLNAPQGQIAIHLGTNSNQYTHTVTGKSTWWKSYNATSIQATNFSKPILDTQLKFNAQHSILETVGPAMTWEQATAVIPNAQNIEILGGTKQIVPRQPTYHCERIAKSAPTAALNALVGVAMSFGAFHLGIGSSLGGGWATASAQAGAGTLASQATISVMQHPDDLGKAAGSLASSRNVRNLISSMVTAGVLQGLNIKLTDSFASHLQHNLARSGIQTTASMVIEGQDPESALETFARSSASGALGTFMAHHIGKGYHPTDELAPKFDVVTHKLLHAANGAASGAIFHKDPAEGAVAGAFGALVAETIVEILPATSFGPTQELYEKDKAEGKTRTLEDFQQLAKEDAYFKARIGEVASILTAAYGKLDVPTTQKTANTALEHNFIPGVLAATYMAYTAYDLIDTWKTQGADAALKHLGIEVVLAATGATLVKTVTKGGKLLFELGNKTIKAEELLLKYIDTRPTLKKIIQTCTNLGSKIKGFDAKADEFVGKAWKVSGKGAKTGKAGKKNVVDQSSFSRNSKITPLDKKGRVEFDGVEFRAVRDLSHLDEKHLREMYRKGSNPKDVGNVRLDGHHHQQKYHREKGAFIVEVPKNKHSIKNLIQHPHGNKIGKGLTADQRKDWNKIRIPFNKERAKEELIKRKILNDK